MYAQIIIINNDNDNFKNVTEKSDFNIYNSNKTVLYKSYQKIVGNKKKLSYIFIFAFDYRKLNT